MPTFIEPRFESLGNTFVSPDVPDLNTRAALVTSTRARMIRQSSFSHMAHHMARRQPRPGTLEALARSPAFRARRVQKVRDALQLEAEMLQYLSRAATADANASASPTSSHATFASAKVEAIGADMSASCLKEVASGGCGGAECGSAATAAAPSAATTAQLRARAKALRIVATYCQSALPAHLSRLHL
mmetsp:Transcript_37226/g.93376  ORF Transcript_37226/g.93376 Transcript_37226/m.93376 type:complete len:188 (+) Transcript_37226:198-761(+)